MSGFILIQGRASIRLPSLKCDPSRQSVECGSRQGFAANVVMTMVVRLGGPIAGLWLWLLGE